MINRKHETTRPQAKTPLTDQKQGYFFRSVLQVRKYVQINTSLSVVKNRRMPAITGQIFTVNKEYLHLTHSFQVNP